MLQAIIFTTGAAILALELLASRILMPYFGVSLYIWSGILSITLVSLALGYWWGGKLTAGERDTVNLDRLSFLFALMPAIAALAIIAACLAYPYVFYELARLDLVLGAFIACTVLLFIPLVATSAMNPLLVAIRLEQRSSRGQLADAGSGRVFFVSTLGSVAGVLLTAFGLIPYLSNFAATLIVAALVAALPLVAISARSIPISRRAPLVITGCVALVSSLGLLLGADAYLGRMWPASYGGRSWTLEKSYRSLFGTVKVLKSEVDENGKFQRIYFQDGLLQNTVDSDNQSTSMYTYALEALASAYQPDMRSALVLGIGAGMVPSRLAGRGIQVTAVDIDAASLRASTEIFGFDSARIKAHHADARTFLRDCQGGYDVIILDLFQGDGVPDYLVTREFFRDLKRCVGKGIAVFNTFADLDYPRHYAHFLTTLRDQLPFIALYRPDYGGAVQHINSYVVASAAPLPAPANPDLSHVPQRHLTTMIQMLQKAQPLNQTLLAHGRVISDAANPAARDLAQGQLLNRRLVLQALPAAFFVN